MTSPLCCCEEYWPGQGHPPDCPTRQAEERRHSAEATMPKLTQQLLVAHELLAKWQALVCEEFPDLYSYTRLAVRDGEWTARVEVYGANPTRDLYREVGSAPTPLAAVHAALTHPLGMHSHAVHAKFRAALLGYDAAFTDRGGQF